MGIQGEDMLMGEGIILNRTLILTERSLQSRSRATCEMFKSFRPIENILIEYVMRQRTKNTIDILYVYIEKYVIGGIRKRASSKELAKFGTITKTIIN